MATRGTIRDSRLIDALEKLGPTAFTGTAWRVVREGRDPSQCSGSGGRWDDASFDVLYTSLDRNGAIAEMYFHLLRGQPVFPSKVRYGLHELRVSLEQALHIPDLTALASLGVDVSRYGSLSYSDRALEYPRSQEISEAAHFLDFDGLLVPNARWKCPNLVVFCDRAAPGAVQAIYDHGLIDWAAWQKAHKTAI